VCIAFWWILVIAYFFVDKGLGWMERRMKIPVAPL
jgi:hypothetical protein